MGYRNLRIGEGGAFLRGAQSHEERYPYRRGGITGSWKVWKVWTNGTAPDPVEPPGRVIFFILSNFLRMDACPVKRPLPAVAAPKI